LARVACVSAPLLSHHLKVLCGAGLITSARRGRWIDYTLDEESMESLAARLGGLHRDEVMMSSGAT
jgi:ArsR family transcriptional regulator